jgi:hypothetical protein
VPADGRGARKDRHCAVAPVGHAFDPGDEEPLDGAQQLDLDAASVGGSERAIAADRLRIGGERPQPHFTAGAVGGTDPRHANLFALLRQAEPAGICRP